MPSIIYTKTDEAPALATYSLLPILRRFTKAAGVDVELKDISVAGRILAAFADRLPADQKVDDALAELGEMAKTPQANIVKLPNISASIPQLVAAIQELQARGYDLPDFPAEPATDEEREIRERYAGVLGSAVNPVLREGNSDRRVAAPVKAFAKEHPHSMGAWSSDSKTDVASMPGDDFFGSERSHTCDAATTVRIVHVASDGSETVLKDGLKLEAGEVIDASRLRVAALRTFLAEAMDEAKAKGILFSLHLKATMMKVSDPILFGHCVEVYFADAFEKHADALKQAGANANNGLGDVLAKLDRLDPATKSQIETDIADCYAKRPDLAMVDSDRGITNLHVPSDIIIDASMPAMIRSSGKMWDKEGIIQDTLAVIPDRSYASVYQAVIDDCREHGAFDPKTMGSVANVGLMAKKAEEYGSHDKTFEAPGDGHIRVIDADGNQIFEHDVAAGDVWRMCQTKDVAIRDWVKLAVSRAKASNTPVVFWLNEERAHDRELIAKVKQYLPDHDTSGLDIQILPPLEATQHALARCRQSQDTISATGNVLRDYLTDLFPILELGTSAKMLSIVPLLAGGGLYETGAGGSAPKHVQQLVREGHFRWDSLGEFLASAVSMRDLGEKENLPQLIVIADALDEATTKLLNEGKSPLRRVGEIGTRVSHFYLALYWAQALAAQSKDADLQEHFEPLAKKLKEAEKQAMADIDAVQGKPSDLGGYYLFDEAKAEATMRPSSAFNEALAT
jgi:isocitrate dehydrogenase